MQRIGTQDGLFASGNPANNTKGTVVTAAWLNIIQEELAGVVSAAGLSLNSADNTQLLTAIGKIIQGQAEITFTTAGVAPNFTLTPVPAITAYTAGERFRVKFHTAGIGNDGLNISGLGNKNLKQYDSTGAKVSAIIAANQLTDVEFDGIDLVVTDALPLPNFVANSGGTADAITATFTPAITTPPGPLFVRAGFANTTPTPTFTPNPGVIPSAAIVKGVNSALAIGDIAGAGYWLVLQYDLTLGKWTLLNPATGVSTPPVASIQGAFKNLQASATGLNASVSITADEIVLEDSSNSYVTARAVGLTINTAGAGANGLDTGTVVASTWYSMWIIRKPDGTTAGLISLSATAPTMPIGYTYKAIIGWIRTDGTGNKYPLGFTQTAADATYKIATGSNIAAMPMMISGLQGNLATPTWAAAAIGAFVPPTATRIRVVLVMQTGATIAMAAPNNSYGSSNSTTNPPPLMISAGGSNSTDNIMGDWAVESSNVYYACNGAGPLLACYGWRNNI